MPVSSQIIISGEDLDMTKPAEVALALRKVQLRLASGSLRETIRMDGEEITYQSGSDTGLRRLIADYEAQAARQSPTARRTRFAMRPRWF